MMIPTAMSTTFPRMANSLNSFNMVFLLCVVNPKITPKTGARAPVTSESL
jgi:hypothetical protein